MKPLNIKGLSACFAGVALLLQLSGCSTTSGKDYAPPSLSRMDAIEEPIPMQEPLSASGNPDVYEIKGNQYRVLKNIIDYEETGIASWYGMKFQGKPTASGEPYDVYRFTAAHKTLPIPSYARVTRKDNGKSVVVRINDRGPFIDGRIVDLSYIAANRLGIDKQGLTEVTLQLIQAPSTGTGNKRWIQTGAFSEKNRAEIQKQKLGKLMPNKEIEVQPISQQDKIIYKVRIGPIESKKEMQNAIIKIKKSGIKNPITY